MQTKDQEKKTDKLCAIIVYGLVPEFTPYLAFRREKHYKTEGTKIIRCPYCREIFTVVAATAKLEIIRYSRQAKILCHESMPCNSCHNRVGIIYASALA